MAKLSILLASLLVACCTYVSADIDTGRIDVITVATHRQDVVIEYLADGTARWSTKDSDPNAALAEAVLNATKIAAKAAGIP